MEQLSFSEAEYNLKKRKTGREKFLAKMDALIPWKQLENKVRRHYAKIGNGRRPYPLNVMLPIHCLQLFYNLSSNGRLTLKIESMRRFAGLSISGPIADKSTAGFVVKQIGSDFIENNPALEKPERISQHIFDQNLLQSKIGNLKSNTVFEPR